MKARPDGYFNRFQAPIEKIRSSIAYRLQDREVASGFISVKAGSLAEGFASEREGPFGKTNGSTGLIAGFDRLDRKGSHPGLSVHIKCAPDRVQDNLPKSAVPMIVVLK